MIDGRSDFMDKILKKASDLGHLLKQNEIIKRFTELSEKLQKSEDSKKLLEELIETSRAYEEKERDGKPIEPEDKKKLSELQEKSQKDELLSEFMATQGYYINLMTQVNEAIANPKGDPPKESDIILPGDEAGKIIV